jgi:NADPH-dependent 2,4-dienoyl-CoA reductase/sulfur reductase-like enzyme
MPDFKYLIIGGGMAANAAVQGIRSLDPSGSLGLLSTEPDPPYKRPPLSKGLWKGKPLEGIWLGTPDQRVELHLGQTAVQLDPADKLVRDDRGTEYHYGKLLLATGGTPRRLAQDGDRVIYFREVADYRKLRALADTAERFVIIGGGFIGSELAAALTMVGRRVTVIFPEVGIGSRLFPAELSTFLNEYYRGKGVEVLAGETIAEVGTVAGSIRVLTQSGKSLPAEAVVAGLGIVPNTQLAADAGLETDDGILVKPSLQTSDPAIYAAGDVARFHNPALGRRMRVEHEDNSVTMGGIAGKSMAGADVRYDHLPYFYSDLFELGYEAVGILDPRLEVVTDWVEPLKKGVIYYLEGGRVRGTLLWDTWGQVEAARALIAEPGPFSANELRGRIRAE